MSPSELDLQAIASVASALQSEGVTREAAAWEASRMWEEGRIPGTTRWGSRYASGPVRAQGGLVSR